MTKVKTKGPNGGIRVYSSITAAARALSGTGESGLRTTIARRCNEGGGYVGNVHVQYTRR